MIFEGSKRLRAASSSVPSSAGSDRYDLLRLHFIKRLLLSRPFRFTLQLVVTTIFLLIIAAGLFGHQNPALNVAPLLTWTLWWCGLVVLILFFGKAWCYVCPWDAIATWAERLRLWKKTKEGVATRGVGHTRGRSSDCSVPASDIFRILKSED